MTDLDDLDAYITHVAELRAEIERLRHDWVVACKDLGEARADNEQLRAAIAHVCQRSQRAGEILNEFDNTLFARRFKP